MGEFEARYHAEAAALPVAASQYPESPSKPGRFTSLASSIMDTFLYPVSSERVGMAVARVRLHTRSAVPSPKTTSWGQGGHEAPVVAPTWPLSARISATA